MFYTQTTTHDEQEHMNNALTCTRTRAHNACKRTHVRWDTVIRLRAHSGCPPVHPTPSAQRELLVGVAWPAQTPTIKTPYR